MFLKKFSKNVFTNFFQIDPSIQVDRQTHPVFEDSGIASTTNLAFIIFEIKSFNSGLDLDLGKYSG